MPKRSSTGANPLATPIVKAATDLPSAESKPEKNPAAVALGRLGGLKGGKARAEALSNLERSQIAKQAALARWQKKG
jgi:hypothetical protein